MHARQALQLKTSQNLVMTQQLQQSIKLLQLNAAELREFIDAEAEKNPFLEVAESSPREDGAEEHTPENHHAETDSERAEAADGWEADISQEASSWQYETGERITVTPRGGHGDVLDLADTHAHEITLRDHLITQLKSEAAEEITRQIALALVEQLDDAGYIREDLSIIALQLNAESEQMEKGLQLLQRLDPAGIGARNLAECLSLQLKDRNRLDPAMQALMDNLPMLAEGKLDSLKRLCGVDMDDLKQMIAEVRSLDPKPGAKFAHEVVQVAEPDVIVQRGAKGQWQIELNAGTLPRVLVNRRYYAEVAAGSKEGDKKYLAEQIGNASWLTKALDQRAQTILKVGSEIVKQQDAFFRLGIHHLRPLTLKDVAAATGYHESTVSRVTTGKYLISPRGQYELKYFFTSGVQHARGGENVSSETVKHLIKQLIDKEDAAHVLSDDELVDRLKAQSVDVARRTVAKYREALGIPSSVIRRRQKSSL